jgi:predicted dehydrogenase
LDNERADLFFAHAPHDEMTSLAAELVDRGLPFHMEKPMGLKWRPLAEVAEKARARGLFVSVPLVSRYMGVVSRLLALREEGTVGEPLYFTFRLFAGTPQRYVDMSVPWMLDPARAGDGPLFNFGPHATDLFLALTGLSPTRVYTWASHSLYRLPIPDLVGYTLEADGCIGTCEVSYTMPTGYERYFSLTTTTLHYGGLPDCGIITMRDGRQVSADGPTFEQVYRLYTEDTIRRFAEGSPPLVGIDQMVKILRLLNAAQRSLAERRAVEIEEV